LNHFSSIVADYGVEDYCAIHYNFAAGCKIGHWTDPAAGKVYHWVDLVAGKISHWVDLADKVNHRVGLGNNKNVVVRMVNTLVAY
jgi:hypothetical protein